MGFSARKKRRTSPNQKTGIDTPINAAVVIARSENLPAKTAEITPTRVPKKSQMIAAPMQSDIVAGIPRLISCATSWRVSNERRTSYWPCFPGISPFAVFCIIRTYWT